MAHDLIVIFVLSLSVLFCLFKVGGDWIQGLESTTGSTNTAAFGKLASCLFDFSLSRFGYC